jgi:hypothetical protein
MRRISLPLVVAMTSGCVVTLPLRGPPPPGFEPRTESQPAAAPVAPPTWAFRCPHPMPASEGGGLCAIPVVHEHPFPPDPAYEPGPDGACGGAPTAFSYAGIHPMAAGVWCDVGILHVHDFAPIVGVAWTSPSPGVFAYAGADAPPRPTATPPPPPDPAALRAAERAEDTAEALETAGKVVKTVGKVGKAVGKGVVNYLEGFEKRGKSSSHSSHSHGSGHHGGGHGGHH